MDVNDFLGGNAVLLALAAFILLSLFLGVRIVPQSEKHVVERFGRLRAVLGPGINFIVPFLDRVAHRVSVLERQLITEPEKTVYRIRDVDGAIATTVAGIVRSEIGKLELDQVQSNRADLIVKVREQVATMVEDWGIEVTRAEILDVSLDDATRAAMLQQLNAERARRAQVTEAEGKKRAVELNADAQLYAAEQEAKARRVLADAEAYATGVIAAAIKESGIEAAQYQVALKQVEALTAVGQGAGKQMIIVPAQALDAFGDAFRMLKGRV